MLQVFDSQTTTSLSVAAETIKENPKYSTVTIQEVIERETQKTIDNVCESSSGEILSDKTVYGIFPTDKVFTINKITDSETFRVEIKKDWSPVTIQTRPLVCGNEDFQKLQKELSHPHEVDWSRYKTNSIDLENKSIFFYSEHYNLLFDIHENLIPTVKTFLFSEKDFCLEELSYILKESPAVLDFQAERGYGFYKVLKADILLPPEIYEKTKKVEINADLGKTAWILYDYLGVEHCFKKEKATPEQLERVDKIVDYFGKEAVEEYLIKYFPKANLAFLCKDEAQKIITGMAHRIPKAIYGVHGRDSGPTLSM